MQDKPLHKAAAAGGSDQLDTEELVRRGMEILSKRRWWFLFSAMLTMTAAVIITRHQVPIYRATGTVHIDLAPPKVLGDVSEVVQLGSSNFFGTKAYYQAQTQIMQSRDVATIVVARRNLARDEYFLGLKNTEKPLTRAQKEEIIATADPVGMLTGRILVELGEDSAIAKVSVEDKNAEFAKDIVNEVMEAYRDRNINRRKRVIEDAYGDLHKIHKDLTARKQSSQEGLYRFEKEHDLSDNRRIMINERILGLNRALREVHTVRLRNQQEMQQLKKFRGSRDIFSASAPALMRDGLVGELKRRYLELQIRKKELDATYLERHPKVETITNQMEQLIQLGTKHVSAMGDAATQQYMAALAEENDLIDQLEKSKAEDSEIRLTKINHDKLIAQAEEDKLFYEKVAKRIAETDMTKEVGVNNVTILDRAVVPKVPVRPNVQLNLLIGGLLSLLVGFGVALAVDLLDNTIKGRTDVEQNLGVPYLGAIPTFLPSNAAEGLPVPEGRLDLYAHYRPNSRVAEASRSVRTNLLFMRPDKPLRTLLVTSANPREGKTATSTTLAITLAASTGNCIIVDTDLRKPRLHKVFHSVGEGGLTSYILSQDPLEKFVRKTEVPGLDLLTCGPLPPNPAEILHTDRFKQLVTELMSKYETVIFDSPPVEIVADALVIASLVDGVLLVAHSEKSKRESVASAIASLRSVKANLLGLVLSRTAARGMGYGYYYGKGYRRGMPYRYRYAADPEKEREEQDRRAREAEADREDAA